MCLKTESTHDWISDQPSVPINLMVTKVTKIGRQPVSIGGGIGYWVDSSPNGPEGWAARLLMTFLYRK